MNKTITTILLVLLVVVGGYFIFEQYQQVKESPANANGIVNNNNNGLWDRINNQNDTNTTTTTTTADVPENWEQYTTSTYSFYHSPEADVQTEAGITKVQMLGPESTTGTEVTDGFTFYVTTVRGFDWQEFRDSIQNLNPEDIMIGNNPATRYTTTTMQGNTSTRVIMETEANTNTVFVTSYTVSDPNNRGYEETINTIMETMYLRNRQQARL